MEMRDKISLENLSLFCHFAGLFSVFIGLVLAFMTVMNEDKRFFQVALYIFFSGYANVKIANKIGDIVHRER